MRNLVIALTLIALCTPVNAALVHNPESFEDDYTIIEPFFYPGWESWGSCSGSGGWGSGNDCGGAGIYIGDGTDGTRCLETGVFDSLWFGYVIAFCHGNPVVGGDIYTFSVDYKFVGTGSNGMIKLEFYDADDIQLEVWPWDPMSPATPDVWHHFSHTFRAPEDAQYVTIVLGSTGANITTRYDMVSLLPAECPYEIAGDEDADCRVTLSDLALMFANWLIDCIDDPTDPACVTP
jgi:hypothetical protein